MGIQLSLISVVEGRAIGCLDVYLLNLTYNGQLASALVYQSDMDNLQSGFPCDRLELQIRSALSRLQILSEP
jgi:hypothetical protein